MAYGLVFDVDGVIADTESLIAQATIEYYRDHHGLELTPEDFHPYVGAGDVRFTSGPAEVHGIDIDLDKAIESCHANFNRLLESGTHIEFHGVKALVEAAAADPDWRIGMATSSPKAKSEATLRATSLDTTQFDTWIAGDMIKRPKPNAEIYVTAALAMRLPPTSCIAIEDAPNGIKSAKDACLKCVAVTNTFPAEQLTGADQVVGSLEEITLADLRQLFEADTGERITWGARVSQS